MEQPQGRKRGPKGKARGTAVQSAAVADKRDPAMYAQRLLNRSLKDIAAEFGVNESTVSRACDRMKAAALRSVEEHRQAQVERVTVLHGALLPQVADGDTDAARTLLLAEKRLADLLGLDAAKKHEVTGAGGTPLLSLEAARALIAQGKQPQ